MDTLEMAKQCGIVYEVNGNMGSLIVNMRNQKLEAFAALVRKAERERVADVVADVAERVRSQVVDVEKGYVLKTVVAIEEAIRELD